MKKLVLKKEILLDGEILTRSQLKNVLGGFNLDTSSTGCATVTSCFNDTGCSEVSDCPSCKNVGGAPTDPGECGPKE
ncbi:hypothetical protein [Pedobacter miscanthi]|uniref:Uncharacterized protein n=1 Tax=Pedobacter miscanthi TaxID=2259170 RepID=A0A366LC82_9SPHI|nr:hypothetical protein [Pedobacter miscanthi]RBQ11507.1 hypothetical protein DRW42_03325 [Pedobacter miscanthi]